MSDATSNLHFESLPLRARFRQLRGRMPMIEAIALASRSDVGVDVPCTYNTIIYTYIITSPSSASTCPHLTAPISYHIFHSACRKKNTIIKVEILIYLSHKLFFKHIYILNLIFLKSKILIPSRIYQTLEIYFLHNM